MACPLCRTKLDKTLFNNVEVDYCPRCLGLWFEQDELQWAKDAKDGNIRWLDIDLWDKEHEFRISPGQKLCPQDRLPLYEVRYGTSLHTEVPSVGAGDIRVDLCNICQGIWLDRGEFQKILQYLQKRADWEVMHKYTKNLAEEFVEIFIGPESLRDEIADFLVLLKLFAHKFLAQHPLVARLISEFSK